ncbi:MAG: TonB-dependent receptor [Bacteroidetes bacterium]|uniref:TonB-dependent receptor n=1 Tax=Phnomibacter sp. TaxID=2836217 RepID=UPI002FDC8AA8|nr:TonB-dependent receptor [Bacteroidota bacterium]
MQTVILTLISIFSTLGLLAQQTTLTGTITDLKKRPIAGVSVSIADSYDGASTDSIGRFAFSTTDTGKHTLLVSMLGYKSWEQPVELRGGSQSFSIQLKESPNELTAVVITAGAFEAGDTKKATVLKPLDIVTTASANADVAAAMKTLPGTQQIGESAELFVRGGEGYETRQFIDGTTVANPFFGQAPNIASRGRFSPFLFKGTVFSTGGYSALYGQALSSALILESIDLPERSEASASFSPLFVGAQYQHLAKDSLHSWGASAGYTNVGLYFKAVKQQPDYFKAPEVLNGDANFRIKTSRTGMLKFYGSYAKNILGLRNPDIDMPVLKNAFELNNSNIYTNISYKERIANRLKLQTGFSYSQNKDNIHQQVQDADNKPVQHTLPDWVAAKNFRLATNSKLMQLRAVVDYKLSGLSAVKAGAEYWYSKDENQYQQFPVAALQDHFTAAFAEADVYISNGLAARAGVRAEHSSLLQKTNVAPRASLAYKLANAAQLSADYGVFYQKPQSHYLMWHPRQNQLRADHYIVTYQKIGFNKVFRAQVFHKEYKQLTKTFPDTSSTGTGYARGAELFWRDKSTFKNFDYWFTYSYLDTKRAYLNYPYEMQPTFAATHTANLIVKRFFTKMKTQLNINYQFAAGRPYYQFKYNNGAQQWDVLDQGKTIAYNNLSFSANYLANMGKAFGVVVLSVTNVLNSKQVFGYNYNADGSNKVAVVPPANRFIFLGLFLSWGTDRTQDAINNNL